MDTVTPATQQAENCEVVAIASRNADRAGAAARQLGIATSYGTYEELLNADDVDAVYIPLPNDMHAEWTVRAAAAGKHVLCEKPLGMTAGEARLMADACEKAGVKLAEAFMYRHHPMWVEAVRLIRAGAIGELQAVQSWFSFFNDDPENIRNRRENGGGALMDIGCYSINLSRMLFQAEPIRIEAAVHRDEKMGIDTMTSAILEFPGGGQAGFTCSIRAEEYQRAQIFGSNGHIEVAVPFNNPSDHPGRIFLSRGGDPPAAPDTETVTFDPVDQYTIQAELFARAVLEDTPLPVPIDDAIANMTVIDSILAS